MKLRTSLLIQLAILLITLVVGAVCYQKMPDQVPTHWNLHNQVDQYGSKWQMILSGPCLVVFGLFLTLILPRISPKNFEIERFTSTFAYAMVLVSTLFLFISIVIMQAANGSKIDIGKGMMVGLFLFFALLGNVLGKVRRNFFMGIRTPWTLASEPVWDATHRYAGYLWVVGGLVGAVLALIGMPIVGSITLILILGLLPVVQSYFLYRKIEKP